MDLKKKIACSLGQDAMQWVELGVVRRDDLHPVHGRNVVRELPPRPADRGPRPQLPQSRDEESDPKRQGNLHAARRAPAGEQRQSVVHR